MASTRQTLVLSFAAILLPAFLPSCKCGKDDTKETGHVDTEVPERHDDWDRGEWLSMATLNDGTPVVAFYNRTKSGLEFAVADPDVDVLEWPYEQLDGFPDDVGADPGDRGLYTSIAVGANDTIWIAYQDKTNGSLRYMKRTTSYRGPAENDPTRDIFTTSWESGMVDAGGGSPPNAGLWASMALDNGGNPVIAHYDAGTGTLRVSRWAGKGFANETVDAGTDYVSDDKKTTIPADVGKFAKLVITSEGEEYIAYYDAAWGRLQLAHGSSGSYTITTVDDSADVGQWPSLLVENDGTVHVAYQDVTNQDLKYATDRGAKFTAEVVDDGAYRGADTALFMNGDFPAIYYFDGFDNNQMLARFINQQWELTIEGGDDSALGFHNEVVSSGGQYYVGCYDFTNRRIHFATVQ